MGNPRGGIAGIGMTSARTRDRLVERLRAERIPLTVCPLSNVKLRVFDTMAEHNLKHLLDLGLCATA